MDNWLEVTEALKDRQDKIAGATAAPIVAEEVPGTGASCRGTIPQQGPQGLGASNGGSFPQQGLPGPGDSSGENFQQQGPMGRRSSGSRHGIMQAICFDPASRTLTALAREAPIILTIKN